MLVFVALAAIVFFVWTRFFAKTPDPAKDATPGQPASAIKIAQLPTAHADDNIYRGPTVADATTPLPAAPTLHFQAFDVQFTNLGGAIAGWKLSDPRYQKGGKDEAQLLPSTIDGAGALQVNYRDEDEQVLLPPKALWTPTKISDAEVKYELHTPSADVVKTFTVYPADFMVAMTIDTTLKQAPPGLTGHISPIVTTYGFQDPKTDESGNARVQPRVWQSASYADGSLSGTAGINVGTDGREGSSPRKADHVQWTGFMHPYLMAVIAPEPLDKNADSQVSKHTEALAPWGLMRTDIKLDGDAKIEPGKLTQRRVVAFFGPKNYDLLEHADQVAGFPTGLKEAIDFGHLPLINVPLSFVGKPLMWLLGELHGFVGNWGVAIILLTLGVKLVTLYWTTRSMRSMKAMAALAPQAQEITKRNGDDKAKAQQETMALYKQHGVSPLAGCAPMFLQIPIWSALYIMLSATGELYQQPFIPGWIDDLTNTDPLHVLPVLLVATMFVQARLTPQAANQPGAKVMQYGMPLMFGVMSFYFPAGLSLYIFTNTVLSSLHSLYMNKFDKKVRASTELLAKNKAMVAAREEAAKLAEEQAKNPRASNGANGSKKKKNGKPTSNGSIKALKENAADAAELPKSSEAEIETDIEATSAELAGADDAEGADEPEDVADAANGGTASTRPGNARPRRKKRRR